MSFWNKIKNESNYFLCAGSEVYHKPDPYEKGKYVMRFPFCSGEPNGYTAQERKKIRAEAKRQVDIFKFLARLSDDENEYEELHSRVSRISLDELNELKKHLKHSSNPRAKQWIKENHLTDRESHILFYRS